MTIIESIILGILQGITEFLPISSSGHLVLLNKILGIEEGTLFSTVMLHFGSLISIFIVYFKDIVNIIKEFIILVIDTLKNKRIKLDNEYKILGVMIIIGSIPTGFMGIFLEDYFEGLYSSLFTISIAFLVTGILLMLAEKLASGKKKARNMTVLDAIIIGIFQGFAITPGISRSGSTIVGGLFRGLDKKLATKFSFLLALPAIFGATLKKLIDAFSLTSNTAITFPIILGTIVSAVTGIFAIKVLIKLLEKKKLHYFSYYLWILGLVLLAIQLFE
ncbi:MAG: undecaprenyl-diphosphatase UppP [Firmicutes bacterium]|nr:undecaprenyl-diphosphatase UppP [Bacillota bacterium]